MQEGKTVFRAVHIAEFLLKDKRPLGLLCPLVCSGLEATFLALQLVPSSQGTSATPIPALSQCAHFFLPFPTAAVWLPSNLLPQILHSLCCFSLQLSLCISNYNHVDLLFCAFLLKSDLSPSHQPPCLAFCSTAWSSLPLPPAV